MSLCSKPGCAHAGAVVLGYDYAARVASLEDPTSGEPSPHVYVLCTGCAERLRPPVGWTLEDRRAAPPLFAAGRGSRVVDLHDHLEGTPAAEAEPAGRQLFFGSSA